MFTSSHVNKDIFSIFTLLLFYIVNFIKIIFHKLAYSTKKILVLIVIYSILYHTKSSANIA